MGSLPRRQRVASYAVILRQRESGTEVLLSRLAPRVTPHESWTLPGGGLEHGEDPRSALVREIWEETGLEATLGDRSHVYSAHLPRVPRDGELIDAHAIRIVHEAWVSPDAPEPRVVEVDGSTSDVAWKPVAGVLDGSVPTTSMVPEAIADFGPVVMQRLAAYGLVVRDEQVLLTQLSSKAAHPGRWTLPGGGVEHGEHPTAALVREVTEETGLTCEVRGLLGVHDTHFSGQAPSGRVEDFHGVHLVYDVELGEGTPQIAVGDLTTEAVAWVPLADVASGEVQVLDVVRWALEVRS